VLNAQKIDTASVCGGQEEKMRTHRACSIEASAGHQVVPRGFRLSTGDGVCAFWSAVYIDAMVLRDRDADANGTLEERVWPLFDANFNVTSLVGDTDAGTAGNQWGVLERYRYEPYGDRVVLNADFTPDTLAGSDSTTADDVEAGWNKSDVLFRHGHQGGAYDRVASEKMLFRFRTLDTQQMRWGQVDPLRYVDGMNAYEGYSSNPIGLLDPLGLYGILAPSVVMPLIEAEKARRAIEQWNQSSPAWSPSNQCLTQSLNQMNFLRQQGPMYYWVPISDGGSGLLLNHNVVKLVPKKPENPLPPMVIDGFKSKEALIGVTTDTVDLLTWTEFKVEYPRPNDNPWFDPWDWIVDTGQWIVDNIDKVNGWGPPLGGQGAHNGGPNIGPFPAPQP
jgi:RHS repeat-associated protein